VARSGGEDAVQPRVGEIGREVAVQHEAHADRAPSGGPLGNRVRHGGIIRIDRLDQGEAVGCLACTSTA